MNAEFPYKYLIGNLCNPIIVEPIETFDNLRESKHFTEETTVMRTLIDCR